MGDVQDRPHGSGSSRALLSLPLVRLALLLAVPSIDVMWEHHPSHFLLVLAVALINVALALVASEARIGARTRVCSSSHSALIASSGFLALHALATPGVLLDHPNSGFVIATPIGLLLASGFAAASAVELSRDDAARILDRRTWIRGALAFLLVAWAIGSLTRRAVPRSAPRGGGAARVPVASAPIGIALYAFAAWRYLRIFRARQRMLPLSVAVAFLLLAEALIAVAFARSWHASWWGGTS